MFAKTILGSLIVVSLPVSSWAVVSMSTTHSTAFDAFDAQLSDTDLIAGLIATELAGDNGWHPANPAAFFGSTDAAGLPTFTNGVTDGGLNGLLNDFPGADTPTKPIQFDLAAPSNIGGINVLTGNENPDGRAFSTFRILASTDNGLTFNPIGGFTAGNGSNSEGYFESDPLGSINQTGDGVAPDGNPAASTFVEITDSTGTIAAGVTNLQFFFYAVDNSQGQYRDPSDGVNPFTGIDDGLTAAFVSPLVWEIDVLASTGGPIGITGDYNASGQVEQGDLDLVLQNWGLDTDVAGIPAGWTNDLPDGQIEQTELDGVLSNWGATSAPDFAGSVVPEPATLSLLALASLGMAGRRCGSRRI